MKILNKVIHALFPWKCVSNYRWVNDNLVCSKCGIHMGFKYTDPFELALDENTGQVIYKTKVFLYCPYNNLIDKESVKV
jgi:hypothetical protein